MTSPRRPAAPDRACRRLAQLVAAAAGVSVATAVGRRTPVLSGRAWVRPNHRGAAVSLVAGPAAAVTASLVSAAGLPSRWRRPALMLGLVSGAVGLYDDIAGARPNQQRDKGLRGHALALREGRLSAGGVKVVGIVGASIIAAGSTAIGPAQRLVAAGVMAASANMVNLLDLRPGRAAKASALAAAATMGGAAGAVGAAVLGTALGVLPADLGEKVMLGDAGANALGALLGFRLAAGATPAVRAAILSALVALTVASERVSFTGVIDATPALRRLDRWGRLPVAAA